MKRNATLDPFKHLVHKNKAMVFPEIKEEDLTVDLFLQDTLDKLVVEPHTGMMKTLMNRIRLISKLSEN